MKLSQLLPLLVVALNGKAELFHTEGEIIVFDRQGNLLMKGVKRHGSYESCRKSKCKYDFSIESAKKIGSAE